MNHHKIGILGARSFVGQWVIEKLKEEGQDYIAFSRTNLNPTQFFYYPPSLAHLPANSVISHWISCLPVKILPSYLTLLSETKAERLVFISSTSVTTKLHALSPHDRAFAASLYQAEEDIKSWANKSGVAWTILRPTMIYDLKNDRNLAKILKFIQRFGFFPIYGLGEGLRQPIYAEDVAAACIAALHTKDTHNHIFNISGKDVMSYREMIIGLFKLAGIKPRFMPVSRGLVSIILSLSKYMPTYKHITLAMFERMNQDLSCDHSLAKQTFNFTPSGFLSAFDKPPSSL